MMKYLLLFTIIALASCATTTSPTIQTPAPAVGTISGVVKDTAGKPLKGVSVNLEVSNYVSATTTDSSGTFYFTNIAAGSYPIYATLPKFSSDSDVVTVSANHNSTINFTIYRTAPFVPLDGLICHFAFANNEDDSSVNHHDGTTTNTCPFVRDRFGKELNAISFTGLSEVIVPDSPDLNFVSGSGFTYCFWINPSVVDLKEYPISKFLSVGGSPGYGFYMQSTIGNGYIQTNNGTTYVNLTDPIPFNAWTFIAVVVRTTPSFSSATVWLNDEAGATTQSSQLYGSTANGEPLVFGKSYMGALDDVRIYNRVLSDEEILDLYHENGW